MDILSEIVKNEFAELYNNEDFLNKFHTQIIKKIRENGFTPIYNNKTKTNTQENFEITDSIVLKNGKELISYSPINESDSEESTSLTSIAIAAAITAGARVFMSYFKNMDGYELYYSDTDSIDINKPLPDEYVGEELGQLKLEHIFDEAVYLAPKMYGGKTPNYEYIKIKGLKNPIPFNELIKLLHKGNTSKKPNQKWYRSLSKGHILIKDEFYTLSITESKRQLLYNSNNIFYNTKPLKL